MELTEGSFEIHHHPSQPLSNNIPIRINHHSRMKEDENNQRIGSPLKCNYEVITKIQRDNCKRRLNNSMIVEDENQSASGSENLGRRQKVEDNRNMITRLDGQKYAGIDSDGADSGVKVEGTSEDDQGPPLPPRPPPRTRNFTLDESPRPPGVKKYVVWCLVCGGTSSLIGVMFLGVYFLLRSYTSSVAYFETVPTFVPATLLMLTGLCVMSLSRRRNRYSYLIKLSGACGVASALTCAVVTVTTTVLHLSRLQTLRQCEYTQKTRTCTCYTVVLDAQTDMMINDDSRFVFDSTADCGIVHGALYSCLRAVFGLSVAGVLIAVFSCMLVYQLLSHERKKMYWEQLELRCRSLYAGPPGMAAPPSGPSIIDNQRNGPCRCCEQCHAHRNQVGPAMGFSWESDHRFWTPGQTGNFYSPTPGGEEVGATNRMIHQPGQRIRGPGWSWPRMPWQRNDHPRFRQTPSSPDSQYGFSNQQNGVEPSTLLPQQQPNYSVIGPATSYGVWGPPPPYSDPNSPARRVRYQYFHPSQCQQMIDPMLSLQQQQQQPSNLTVLECQQQSSSCDPHSMEQINQTSSQQSLQNHAFKRQGNSKNKDNYKNSTPTASDSSSRDRFSSTLPVRKTKKRIELASKSIGPQSQMAQRINVQNIFFHNQTGNTKSPVHISDDHSSESNRGSSGESSCLGMMQPNHPKIRKLRSGVENDAFQENEVRGKIIEPCESEVYFADVSSCCNMSLKNDNYYEDANQRQTKEKNGSYTTSGKDEGEDYLLQRFGKRETTNRLSYPHNLNENYEKNLRMNLSKITPQPSLINKDISRQSMCSTESDQKTDLTDLSPTTPIDSLRAGNSNFDNDFNDYSERNNCQPNFVPSSYPYSSNEKCQEAHRRSTKNLQDGQIQPLGETSQYMENIPHSHSLGYNSKNENVSKDNYNKNKTTGNFYHHQHGNNDHSSGSSSSSSSKNLNVTPNKRQSLGTNLSTMIQNLDGNEVSLMYSENRRENDIIFENPQDCNFNSNSFNNSSSSNNSINNVSVSKSSKNNKNIQQMHYQHQSTSDNEWASDTSDKRL